MANKWKMAMTNKAAETNRRDHGAAVTGRRRHTQDLEAPQTSKGGGQTDTGLNTLYETTLMEDLDAQVPSPPITQPDEYPQLAPAVD